MATTFVDRAFGSSDWLRGPNGPPFFNAAFFMGLMYGGIAAALERKPRGGAFFFGPFLGMAAPLFLMTRLIVRPDRGGEPDPFWLNSVVLIYVAAVWGSILAVGYRLARGWKGAAFCVGGALGAFFIFTAIGKLAPGLFNFPWRPGYLPQPQVMLDGLLTGAGMAAGIAFARRSHA